ncbi:ATP-binding protein [Infirmifilum lucidum]|uniref:ATP-binding protein n=1 Tax=Infirmifilum lucidum TaxID=2776706 RepID=A0A7L9FIU4_9CREN|nr:ATP-binding protein [Infirmifilum lucidum]QOJ78816.1 ATP-binding protein [Infirmifilum lucidum]
MEKVGVVISRTPPTELAFEFEVLEPGAIATGDFVEVPVERGALLARVAGMQAVNAAFSELGVVTEASEYGLRLPSAALLSSEVHVARARALEVITEDGELAPPLHPPSPGTPVYKASRESISRLLGFREGGVWLGEVWHSGVDALLDPESLVCHHVAVVGATGSGKSHTLGVLSEELLEHGYPVVVVDVHGEYGFLAEEGYRARALKLTGVSLKPGLLSPDAVAEATEMTEVQRDLLHLAYDGLEGVELGDVIESVERVAREYGFRRETVVGVIRRLKTLKSMGVFAGSEGGVPPEELVEEGSATVLEVGLGLPERAVNALVGTVVWLLFEARRSGAVPGFALVVDEAQRFLPQEEDTFSRRALRVLAREGRKFRTGIMVASQRVVGLDKDVLSQSGTKVVLRMDSVTDLSMLKLLLGQSARLVPHLPRGVAIVAGVTVRYPVMVKVRGRKS